MSGKRERDDDEEFSPPKRMVGKVARKEQSLRFEDPFEDEISEEEFYEGEVDADMGDAQERPKVWRAGVDGIEDNEVLDYDPAAYKLMHAMHVEWPCLSFDIIGDHLGDERRKLPVTCYLAAGTQADRPGNNKILLMKASDLGGTGAKFSSDDDEDDDSKSDSVDDEEGDPVLEYRSIDHVGGVNRLRCMPQQSSVIATWSDTGKVHIWDASQYLRAIDEPPRGQLGPDMPITTFSGHSTEGFAMDWSVVVPGRFLSGDCAGATHLWERSEGGRFVVDKAAFAGQDSVEDLQWSPNQADVFASATADKMVRIWDARQRAGAALEVEAHASDVNVLSWNRLVPHLLVSGGDDGAFKVWDLRMLQRGEPSQFYSWHSGPITSVEWHPTDSSCLGVASADNTISLWDFSLEADAETAPLEEEMGMEVPPQLLFIHQGQNDVKEIHWHRQVPGVIVSTALDGFNIFRAVNF